MDQNGSTAMLIIIKLACVTEEVNLRNLLQAGDKHTMEGPTLSLTSPGHYQKSKIRVSVAPPKLFIVVHVQRSKYLHKQTVRQTDRHTERQTDRTHTHTHTHKCTHVHLHKQTHLHTHMHTCARAPPSTHTNA